MRWITLIPLLLASTQALAQTPDYEQKFWQKSLLGWGGIALRCIAEEIKEVTAICDAAAQEADFLTATAKIPFVYTGRSTAIEHYQRISNSDLKHPITLSIKIVQAGFDGNRGVTAYAEISAGDFYIDAVEAGAQETEPTYRPKSGQLEIWLDGVIAYGPADYVKSELIEKLKSFTKEFVTNYIKYRKPMN